MSNAQEFLTLFNQLEQYLDGLNNSTEHFGFRRLIDSLSKTNEVVATYKFDLVEFLELRNAIVHKSTGEPIAEPDAKVVTKLRTILNELTHPLTAMDLASHPVFMSSTTSLLTEVLATMSEHFYAAIPVFHDNHFVGVFSDRSLVLWLHAQPNKGALSLEGKTLGQLREYFHDENDKHYGFQFISKETTAFAVREKFISFLSQKKRLVALFVTNSGTSTEPIEGIITAWDLPNTPN